MGNISVDPLRRIQHLEQIIDQENLQVHELVSLFRAEKSLLSELPTVFEGALEAILERLESTAMFSEEACSFSRSDLHATLSVWLEKAKSWLQKQAGFNQD